MESVGIEQGRARLGDIVNDALYRGTTTYITRNGKPIAAVVPLDRAIERSHILGTAYWDADSRTLTIRPEWSLPERIIHVDRIAAAHHRQLALAHVLALAGWRVAHGSAQLVGATTQTKVVHIRPPDGQAEQLAAWSAQYGHHQALVRGTSERIRFLVVTNPGIVLEGDAMVLEMTDPNGTLRERALTAMAAETPRASIEGRESAHSLSALIAGIGLEGGED